MSSNSKTCPTTSAKRPRLLLEQISTCPFDANSTYTHNMCIDYGRIDNPSYYLKSKSHQKLSAPVLEVCSPEVTERRKWHYRLNPEATENGLLSVDNGVEAKETKRKIKVSLDSTGEKENLKSSKRTTGSVEKRCARLKSVCALNKKTLHTRIVKTYVAGGKMQVRLINYPDVSEYERLCHKIN